MRHTTNLPYRATGTCSECFIFFILTSRHESLSSCLQPRFPKNTRHLGVINGIWSRDHILSFCIQSHEWYQLLLVTSTFTLDFKRSGSGSTNYRYNEKQTFPVVSQSTSLVASALIRAAAYMLPPTHNLAPIFMLNPTPSMLRNTWGPVTDEE